MGQLLKEFIKEYVQGNLEGALNLVLQYRESSYDKIVVEDEGDRLIINYVEEGAFGRTENFKIVSLRILNLFVTDCYKSIDQMNDFLNRVAFENQLIYYTTHFKNHIQDINALYPPFQALILQNINQVSLDENDISQVVSDTSIYYKSLVEFQLSMTTGWQKFIKIYPEWVKLFSFPYPEIHPWFPLKQKTNVSLTLSEGTVPVIFLEPFEDKLNTTFSLLKEKIIIYVFYTKAHFFQMLANSFFVESYNNEKHLIYILDFYPNDQLKFQKSSVFKNKNLKAYLFDPTKTDVEFMHQFIESLQEVLKYDTFDADNIDCNTLYEISKRFSFFYTYNRLGKHYIPSLYAAQITKDWFDAHKGQYSSKILVPSIDEVMLPVLKDLKKGQVQKKKTKKDKYLLAHIVSEIVDGEHAPTRVLTHLITNANRNLFNLLVVCTESAGNHVNEYPINDYVTESSENRGKEAMSIFQSHQAKLIRNANLTSYRQEGDDLANILNEYDVDIAVFHGPDVINLMGAQKTTAPLKVFFEHGPQCFFEGFNLAILNTNESKDLYKETYAMNQTQIETLNLVIEENVGVDEMQTKVSIDISAVDEYVKNFENILLKQFELGADTK